ncbi:MAG: methylmalonyl Co-A mutase-associated GTPase MeaB [Sandaracinaceae bacterium]|nr:methylmalonyl Co-A mutase-associated GTPase MeaB [Sandaracinaceae bacterium]
MRIIDDRREGYLEVLSTLFPHSGRAYVVGITGNPGAGKSTLVDRLIENYRASGKKVGVIAVDPTSPFTGGAILGDRIRMQRHFLDPNVFIRSLATRGHLGGLSRSAGDVIRVLDAFGCDVILVETVGVGQDELEVTRMAHTTLVIVPPGMGDDIQAIKAGILEIADVFAVNKADREGADSTVRDLEQMMSLGHEVSSVTRGHSAAGSHVKAERKAGEPWRPPVIKTVAVKNEGVADVIRACEEHRKYLETTDDGQRKALSRATEELHAIFRDALLTAAESRAKAALEDALKRSLSRTTDPYSSSAEIVRGLLAGEF